ncbi:hypothetical protein CYMTET_43026 [Cymbomonas tetramitiformis]|uniref:Uncharacterized protein n=1 Tax=Cymbomonas tetramitiformis TaxID=36881 RepID=A0AAE0F122_9CHLO|nr:hypothetical protein CYMTET_43026 [Cymbomonas tetramitiformis]
MVVAGEVVVARPPSAPSTPSASADMHRRARGHWRRMRLLLHRRVRTGACTSPRPRSTRCSVALVRLAADCPPCPAGTFPAGAGTAATARRTTRRRTAVSVRLNAVIPSAHGRDPSPVSPFLDGGGPPPASFSIHQLDDEDVVDWPAFRDSPVWVPPIQGSHAAAGTLDVPPTSGAHNDA